MLTDEGKIVAWWKMNNLLLSNFQKRLAGLYPPGQLTLWIGGTIGDADVGDTDNGSSDLD